MYISKRIFKIILVIIAAIIVVAFASKAVGKQRIQDTSTKAQNVVYKADTEYKIISVTVEVNANTQDYTEQILNVLNKNNVKATFFLTGQWVEANKDLAKKISDSGHEIGNHSNTHKDMKKMMTYKIEKEITDADQIISQVYTKQIELFKPPFSYVGSNVINAADKKGKTVIIHSIDSLDWKSANADYIINIINSNIKPGDIICFHNDAKYCADSLDSLLPKLKEQGYKFDTVGEILKINDK